MGFAPFHHLAQLLPMVHRFKGHLLHRRAGDDHTIKPFPPNFLKGLIELQEVLLGGVFGFMGAYLEQLHLHLQGGVAEHPEELGFGFYLFRHQVEQNNPQRSYVLMGGAVLVYGKYMFLTEQVNRGQSVRYGNGHWGFLLSFSLEKLNGFFVCCAAYMSCPFWIL